MSRRRPSAEIPTSALSSFAFFIGAQYTYKICILFIMTACERHKKKLRENFVSKFRSIVDFLVKNVQFPQKSRSNLKFDFRRFPNDNFAFLFMKFSKWNTFSVVANEISAFSYIVFYKFFTRNLHNQINLECYFSCLHILSWFQMNEIFQRLEHFRVYSKFKWIVEKCNLHS